MDSDNGTEFINDELIDWLRARNIKQTRSRLRGKNDQAAVESKNNHVVRKFAFYWCDDTPSSLACLTDFGRNLHAAEPVHPHPQTRARRSGGGQKRTVCDQLKTPWTRVLEYDAVNRASGGSGYVDEATRACIKRLISDTNPAQLGREIAAIQDELERLSRQRTKDMTCRIDLDMGYAEKTIDRMHVDAERNDKWKRRYHSSSFMTNLGNQPAGTLVSYVYVLCVLTLFYISLFLIIIRILCITLSTLQANISTH